MMFWRVNKDVTTGERGEHIAMRFLKKNRYRIIARNWYNKTGRRLGEIDIIAMDKVSKELVFVEVKTRVLRNEDEYIIPEEQITASKLHKLQRIAECYIKENDLWDKSWRYDAVSVLMHNDRIVRVTQIKNIFF